MTTKPQNPWGEIPHKRRVKVELTVYEAEMLKVLIGEGREGILTDESNIKGFLGGQRGADAAIRACDKLDAALEQARKEKRT